MPIPNVQHTQRIKILTGSVAHTAEFEKELNDFLADGWFLLGNLLTVTDEHGRVYYNQMIGFVATGSGGK